MEKELKTLLVLLSKFIKTIGCEKAIFDFSYDGNSYYQNKMRCNGNYINMPIEISPFLEKYLRHIYLIGIHFFEEVFLETGLSFLNR